MNNDLIEMTFSKVEKQFEKIQEKKANLILDEKLKKIDKSCTEKSTEKSQKKNIKKP